MKSKLFIVVLCTLIAAAFLVILSPASAASGEGSNISGLSDLHKVYPPTSPAHYSSSSSKGPAPTLPVSGSKSQVIQQLRNQSFTQVLPDNAPRKPLPAPTQAPTPGYSFEPSQYTDGHTMKFFSWRASSEKVAEMNPKPTQPGTKITSTVTENGKKVTQANNQFAIDLYSELADDPNQAGKNLFFSPWSISTALAINYEGARGDTAGEIQSVFHFPADTASRRAGFSEIISGLNRGGSGYTLRTTNALWAEKTYPFRPEYTYTVRNSYSASVANLDFINNPEDSRTIINTWVAQQTSDRIQDLLPSGSIDPLTRLVITNAIYFKGTWDKQFSKDNTVEEEFLVSPSQTVLVPMMKQTDEDAEFWLYTETDTLQVLGMPYAHKDGKELSMLVILPKGGDLAPVEQSLDTTSLSELQQAMMYKQVMVYFPRFRLEADYRLSDTLKEMGMPTAFIPGEADLSGMDGTTDLYIDDIFHKAFVDVNEEGTEAAAATAVAVSGSISFEPIPVFRADHPFIFLIQDNDTGNILFMGRVVNPVSG